MALAIAVATAASKEPAAAGSKTTFLRLRRQRSARFDGNRDRARNPQSPEKQDVTIDLIGAVHIGEKAYYDKLNEEFEQYEALLSESVAPEGICAPKGGGTGSGHPWRSCRMA